MLLFVRIYLQRALVGAAPAPQKLEAEGMILPCPYQPSALPARF